MMMYDEILDHSPGVKIYTNVTVDIDDSSMNFDKLYYYVESKRFWDPLTDEVYDWESL